jgi:hypothetical protein
VADSRLSRFIHGERAPDIYWIGWVGPKDSLDAVPGIEPRSSSLYTDWAIPGAMFLKKQDNFNWIMLVFIWREFDCIFAHVVPVLGSIPVIFFFFNLL